MLKSKYNDPWIYSAELDGFLNQDTGELQTDYETTKYRKGSIFYVITPEQIEKKKEEKAIQHPVRGKEDFYFVNREHEFDLIPSDITKLVYLSTFTRYKDNTLMKTERKPMTLSDLPEVLEISRKSVDNFVKAVIPKYITIDNDMVLHIDSRYFRKGKIKSKEWMKMYKAGVKNLFANNPKLTQKQIGYILLVLGYINYEYNALCWNPSETELDKVDFMTVAEFCEIIGYDVNNHKRLIDAYGKIRIDINGKSEKFCSFVISDSDLRKAKMYINPKVMYCGNHADKVHILGAFCQ